MVRFRPLSSPVHGIANFCSRSCWIPACPRSTEKKFDDTGRLDHIAFAATNVEGIRKRLQSRNVKFRESIVPRTGDTQIFLYDPDGVGVELNFPGA
jgi:hypothetical protein